MTRRPRQTVLLALAALLPTLPACDPASPELPPVATIRITPADAEVDVGDTVQLVAEALDEAGDAIPGAVLLWSSENAFADVDDAGLATARSAGVASIAASADNGVRGWATIWVSPLAAMTPDTGRYGTVVTLEGDDVLADASVFFTDPSGSPIRALTRSAGTGTQEVWVPVGAGSGPLRLQWPGGTATTRREFELTAQTDVLAGGATLPVPYHNPSLLADGTSPHAVSFTLPAPAPFTLELMDRGDPSAGSAVRAWLFRTDVTPSVLTAFLMTRDLPGNVPLDSVAYARESLPAGEYTVIVAPMDVSDPSRTSLTRPFGLRLDTVARFDRPPDGREPNDFPAEAPTVTLPFTGTGLGLETPYGMDHYTFEVADTTTVTVTATATDSALLVYLLPDSVADILAAWEADAVLGAAGGLDTIPTVAATLAPGRYTALVWDWGGGARPYDLEISAGAPLADASPAPRWSAGPAAWARPPWHPLIKRNEDRR